ncbi:MAG: hypothetical protein ACQESG_04570 [Nanobdellota archaeon]
MMLDLIRRLAMRSRLLTKLSITSSPLLLEWMTHHYARSMARRCARRVPAYKRFLERNGVKMPRGAPDSLPVTTKKNYIFPSKLSDLCIDGNPKAANLLVKSSGHSGREQLWAKSNAELAIGKVSLAAALDTIFDLSKPTLAINGYILSSWVTGCSFALMGHESNALLNIGPKKQEILEAIKTYRKTYHQIIVLGYPPFIKQLVDFAQDFRWEGVHFFVGGEYFPESFRQHIIKKTHGRLIGGYGTSDFGIIGGIETEGSIKVRQAAKKNFELFHDLYQDATCNPVLFQLSPSLYATAKNRELHFTTVFPETCMPLVNYNLKDRGGVISYKQMRSILRKHDLNIGFDLKLPFIFVEGRSTGALKYYAFMIYPENIKQAIYRNPSIAKHTTGNFHLSVDYQPEQLNLTIELAKGVKKKGLKQQFQDALDKSLIEINRGYASVREELSTKAKINVMLKECGTMPHGTKYRYT